MIYLQIPNIWKDTGPLVAYLDKRDQYHYWAANVFGELPPPFITCEAVISETIFLLQRKELSPKPVFDLIQREDLTIRPALSTKATQKHIRQIIQTYKDLPADFADACLVTLYEQHPKKTKILTVDSDFTIYRTRNETNLSLISPYS